MSEKEKAHLFTKGKSGNPNGRPAGVKNKISRRALEIMESGAEEIIQTVMDSAKGGDLSAAKIVIDKLIPAARERPIVLPNMPDTSTITGVNQAQEIVLQAVAAGDISPGEASTLAGVIEVRRKAIETQELEQRITALEAKK